MKEFLNSISNKIKAIYILWIFSHFFLWIFQSRKGLVYYKEFYPFNSRYGFMNPYHSYDLSELIFYIITPLVIYYVIYLFRK